MKKLLTLIGLTSIIWGQDYTLSTENISTALINSGTFTIKDENLNLPNQERIAKIGGKIYQVKYTNITVGCSVPATYPSGQPHHGCKCLVYYSEDDLLIGEMPNATWTPQGCFEDNPQIIAEQVLENLRNNL